MDAPQPNIDSVIEFARAKELFPPHCRILGKEIGDGNVNYVYRLWSEDTGEAATVVGRAMSEIAAAYTELFRRRMVAPTKARARDRAGLQAPRAR